MRRWAELLVNDFCTLDRILYFLVCCKNSIYFIALIQPKERSCMQLWYSEIKRRILHIHDYESPTFN